jgi:hypothetical protein
MFFFPERAAFRAGSVDGTQWDDVNVGGYSIAMGWDTTASGTGSTAMGNGATASGSYSTAIGFNTTASEYGSTAMGHATTASGDYSTAMGRDIEVQGDYSFGISLDFDLTPPVITDTNTMAIMNGEVGIGTVSPSHILHVNGVARSTQSSWDTSSDERVKTNITELSGSLDKILSLRPVTYEYTEDYVGQNESLQGTKTSFIAQEVKEIFPQMVRTVHEEYGPDDDRKVIEDFYLLNTGEMIPVLVGAIKEQQEKPYQPNQMTDQDAPHNSIYYSTDSKKLVYKDPDGNVNNLY